MSQPVEAIATGTGKFHFTRRCLRRRTELEPLRLELEARVREEGLRPILVFDMHGSSETGLSLGEPGQGMPWERLGELLRAINVATGNNLCVVGATCYSLTAIKSMTITSSVPFFVLLAARSEVKVGFLEDNFPAFFKTMLADGGIDEAYYRYLARKLEYFHCEKMLFIMIACNIRSACRGKGAVERRERLLTEVLQNGPNTPETRKEIRQNIKEGIRPDRSLLERYTEIFLIGKPCGFDMKQLLKYVERAIA